MDVNTQCAMVRERIKDENRRAAAWLSNQRLRALSPSKSDLLESFRTRTKRANARGSFVVHERFDDKGVITRFNPMWQPLDVLVELGAGPRMLDWVKNVDPQYACLVYFCNEDVRSLRSGGGNLQLESGMRIYQDWIEEEDEMSGSCLVGLEPSIYRIEEADDMPLHRTFPFFRRNARPQAEGSEAMIRALNYGQLSERLTRTPGPKWRQNYTSQETREVVDLCGRTVRYKWESLTVVIPDATAQDIFASAIDKRFSR